MIFDQHPTKKTLLFKEARSLINKLIFLINVKIAHFFYKHIINVTKKRKNKKP
jgi:hypothetical protein